MPDSILMSAPIINCSHSHNLSQYTNHMILYTITWHNHTPILYVHHHMTWHTHHYCTRSHDMHTPTITIHVHHHMTCTHPPLPYTYTITWHAHTITIHVHHHMTCTHPPLPYTYTITWHAHTHHYHTRTPSHDMHTPTILLSCAFSSWMALIPSPFIPSCTSPSAVLLVTPSLPAECWASLLNPSFSFILPTLSDKDCLTSAIFWVMSPYKCPLQQHKSTK